MGLEDIIKFQLKRVNPFQGLVIDVDTWKDAHNYHRDQQRLHVIAFHGIGIVDGLEVTANVPPDLSVNISPGMAVDPDGNIVIVAQKQRYRLQTRKKGTVYLTVQFREIPGAPFQPPEGGQPTRIIEAYKIEEGDNPSAEACLELGRINFDPSKQAINDSSLSSPGINEIDLHFRKIARAVPVAQQEELPPRVEVVKEVKEIAERPLEVITIGHAVLGGGVRDLHTNGLKNLAKELNRQGTFTADVKENVTLNKDINQLTILYLTGSGRFDLTSEQQASLDGLLKSGGVIFGEACAEGQGDAGTRGIREFGLAFNQLATQLKCKLEVVQRTHPLLSSSYIFSAVPQGTEQNVMLLEGGRMIYSGNDYGCAWQGGHQNEPLQRELIRNCFEMGINIITFAHAMKTTH